uniref:Uncharacterized protein n=1 Tax=Panagrolaimus sp. PS1159 TaxID=55785 RepID=A0AC35GQY3_9BILA
MSEEELSVVYASHVLKTKIIRIYDAETDEINDKQISDTDFPTNFTDESQIKTYINALLNLTPRKLDCLVFVNSGQCDSKLLQTVVSFVTNGILIKVIPALMARFLYVVNSLEIAEQKTQTLLILTKISSITEFHALQCLDDKKYYFINETPKYYNINIPSSFATYITEYGNGGKSVILYDEENAKSKDEIVQNNKNNNIIEMLCPSWEEMLLCGGLYKASALIDPKDITDIKDFTIGFNISVDGKEECLIEKGKEIPIEINVTKKLTKKFVIRSNSTAILKQNILKLLKFVQEQDIKPEGLYNIKIDPADFMICLKDRLCCVSLPSEGNNKITKRTKSINGNEWIPLYISFSQLPPLFGERAEEDLLNNPEFVVYDILSFISESYDKVKINPEWAFDISYDDSDNTVLDILTWDGYRSVKPVKILSLIFTALRKEAERIAGKSLKNVFIKMSKVITKEDSEIIKEALKIASLECIGIETL